MLWISPTVSNSRHVAARADDSTNLLTWEKKSQDGRNVKLFKKINVIKNISLPFLKCE